MRGHLGAMLLLGFCFDWLITPHCGLPTAEPNGRDTVNRRREASFVGPEPHRHGHCTANIPQSYDQSVNKNITVGFEKGPLAWNRIPFIHWEVGRVCKPATTECKWDVHENSETSQRRARDRQGPVQCLGKS